MSTAHELAVRAKAASRVLATTTAAQRNQALEAMAVALEESRSAVRQKNSIDMLAAQSLRGAAALAPATLARLDLSDARLDEMIEQVRAVAALDDPLGRRLTAVELDHGGPRKLEAAWEEKQIPRSAQDDSVHALAQDDSVRNEGGLWLEKISVPLGVLAVIFEARPDAVTQIAALAIKSGNAVLMKPGSEVEQTAMALIRVLRGALAEQGLPQDAITLVAGREQAAELLAEHKLIDMVIPRGSNALVEYVQANTRIPVLGHADGVCHIYVDQAADEAMALRVIADAKCDYPAACNAVETVLVHRAIAAEFLPRLAEHLRARGVRLHGDAVAQTLLQGFPVGAVDEWHTEWGGLAMSLGVVDSIEAAMAHIHEHGSSHTESIVTEDAAAAETFLREVDAAGVFHNASTRFADGYRYGFGAEVGVSTSKLHARGPVGLDGLTTYKYVLRGAGQVAGDYRGAAARAFTHRKM